MLLLTLARHRSVPHRAIQYTSGHHVPRRRTTARHSRTQGAPALRTPFKRYVQPLAGARRVACSGPSFPRHSLRVMLTPIRKGRI